MAQFYKKKGFFSLSKLRMMSYQNPKSKRVIFFSFFLEFLYYFLIYFTIWNSFLFFILFMYVDDLVLRQLRGFNFSEVRLNRVDSLWDERRLLFPPPTPSAAGQRRRLQEKRAGGEIIFFKLWDLFYTQKQQKILLSSACDADRDRLQAGFNQL